ncbi:MAG: hypothetical protein ACREQD_11135, partial [Candidatus Binataceae bacterium]
MHPPFARSCRYPAWQVIDITGKTIDATAQRLRINKDGDTARPTRRRRKETSDHDTSFDPST